MKKRLKTFNISENLYNSLIDYFTDGKHRVGHDFIEGTRLVKMDQKDFIHGTKYKINPKIDVNRQCLCVTLLNLPTEYTDNIKSSYANYDFYQIILKCNIRRHLVNLHFKIGPIPTTVSCFRTTIADDSVI